MPDGPYAKLLASLSKYHKQNCPQIPTQPRPTTTTTKKAPATTPSTKSDTGDLHIYQPPPSRRGWASNRDLKAPLRYLGLLDVARLKLPTGVPRPRLVSQLISSYDRDKGCGYISGTRVRVNVDRKSFLSAVSLHPTPKRGRDLLPNVPLSAVTRAARQFISMCLRVQSRGDMLPILSAAVQEVEAGSAQKVDWGKLMWDLVENEILELPKRDDKVSYFGIYLQRLILVQLPQLFKSDTFQAALQGGAWVKTAILRAGTKPMEVQSSQLGAVTLNDDVGVGNSVRQRLSSTLNDGKMDTDEHNDHTESQHRFIQQGNQQHKRAWNNINCGGVVPTGSASAIANSSHDIADIERELKNATSDELHEAETLIQVVKLLQEELSAEAIMHIFE
nr:uncharacterized protein LOC127318127 isoform X1 [Lolium perenne]